MTEQLGNKNNRVFDSSDIPALGYELGQTETVSLRLSSGSIHDADGILTDSDGVQSSYEKIARLRLGGNETYEDFDAITVAVPAGSRYEESGIPALLRHRPEGAVAVLYGQLLSSDKGGVVGRDNELFKDLPDTVSREHLSIEWDKDTGTLVIHNLDPTNGSILLPPETPDDQTRQPVAELEAAIELDPNEVNNEQTIEDYLAESAVERSEREAQLARARRRRRLATQTAQRAIGQVMH